jgi:hypothetical protein
MSDSNTSSTDNPIQLRPQRPPTILDAETAADAVSLTRGLTRVQAAAFDVLTAGGSIATAAKAANVTRKTIYDWLAEGHRFAEAYTQWKQSIAETARTRLLMIGEAATVHIAKAVKQGDTRTALAVAKGMGILAPPAVGPTIHEASAKKRAAEAAKAEAERTDTLSATPFRDLVNVDSLAEELLDIDEAHTIEDTEKENDHDQEQDNQDNDEAASDR